MTIPPELAEPFSFWARSGYCGDELVDEAEERAQDVFGRLDPAQLRALRAHVRAELAAQRAREAGWADEETVNDRITAAFAELTDSGIVALENAGYTQSDGREDCEDAADALRADGVTVRGAVFFHGQDVERGVAGQGLLLGFFAFEPGDPPAVAIAEEVVTVLRKHGVDATWPGSPKKRIAIAPFAWRRRAFTAPDGP